MATKIVGESPAGTRPGVTFTLANTPIALSEAVYWAGGGGSGALRLRRVGAAPAVNEYTITGATLTMGSSVGTNDDLQVDYLF